MAGQSVGSLFLEYGIDTSQYNKQLEQMRSEALRTAKDLEKQFAGSFKTPTFKPLVPAVDTRQLHNLNKLLDIKQAHWRRAGRDFSKPIVARVNTTDIVRASKLLTGLAIQLRQIKDTSVHVSASVSNGGSGQAGSSTRSRSDNKQLADMIGRAVARHTKPGLLGSIASVPFKALGFAGRELLSGGLMDIGAGFTRGLGVTRGSQQAGKKTAEYARKINQYLIGVEDVMAGFVAEITRSGDISRAVSVGSSRARLNQYTQRLAKMQQVATLGDDFSQAANIPEIMELVPEEKRAAFKADPKGFIKKDRRLGVAIARRSQELIQELNPQDVIQDLINPLIAELGGITGFIGKVQANRAVIEATGRRKDATRPLLPNLQQGQQGYVNVIGGAMFRQGQGYRQLDSAFEGLFPSRRVLGVANPETDPSGEPKGALAQTLFNLFKRLAPDMAANQEMSNTIANAVTMLAASVDPMYKSNAVSDALANILAAQEAGIDPSKVATVSYSMGGMEAQGLAQALKILGLDRSKVMAMGYPGLNFRGQNPSNFQSTLIEEDPLGFAKNVLRLGRDDTHRTYKAGVPPSASAHAYKHYFKNEQQVDDFYSFLGIEERPDDLTNAAKFLNQGSQYYEAIGSMMQAQSLAQTGQFDMTMPLKSFQGNKNLTGSAVISKFLESVFKMSNLPTGGMSSEQQAIQMKFKERIEETYQVFLQSLIDAGEDVTSETSAQDLYGKIKYADELKKYNTNIEAFQTGKPSDDAYFAGDFDPIKVKQRFADLDKAEAFFGDESNLPKSSAYREKILLLFKNLRAVMKEFADTGKVSEQTLATIRQIQPEKFSPAFERMSSQTMDDTSLPGIESTRKFQTSAPNWAYNNPAAIVAYNKMVQDVGDKGYVPPLDQIKTAAYGMSGASAFITDDFVYKNDIGDSSKIASDQEVRAYKRLAGRFAPLLYEADPGKSLVTERIKGTPVKDILDQAAKPAKAARARLDKLRSDLQEINKQIANADEDADTSDLKAKQAKLTQQIQRQSEGFRRARLKFNDTAEGIYTQIGQLGKTLQSMGVAHNDLASGNVFVMPDGSVKAIDLGNAKVNPTRMDRIQDQATTVQRAIIDRDYYGILDPLRAGRAINRGYSMPAMALPEKRKGSIADLPQYQGIQQVPLGSDADTFLEQTLGYKNLAASLRPGTASRTAERLRQRQVEAEAAALKAQQQAEQSRIDNANRMAQRMRSKQLEAQNRRNLPASIQSTGMVSPDLGYRGIPNDVTSRVKETLEKVKPVKLPVQFEESNLVKVELDIEQSNIAQRAVEALGDGIQRGLEKVADSIESGLVDRVNSQLMRVPGQPDTIDPSNQISQLSDLTAQDAGKLARLGVEDALGGMVGGTAKTLSVLKAFESTLFSVLPPLKAAKTLLTQLGIPIAVGMGAQQLPVVGGAIAGGETAIAQLLTDMLSAPGAAVVADASGSLTTWMTSVVEQIGTLGGNNPAARALAHGIEGLLNQALEMGIEPTIGFLQGAAQGTIRTVAGGVAGAITPVVSGQALLGAGKVAAGQILPQLSPEQIAANKQLQAQTEQRLKQMKEAVATTKALMGVDPAGAARYTEVMQSRFPELAGNLDQGLAGMEPLQRMMPASGGGAKLANLKSQILNVQKTLKAASDQTNKLQTFLTQMVDAVGKPLENLADAINVEVISSEPITEIRALPDAQDRLQKQINESVKVAADQILDIGDQFREQVALASQEGVEPSVKAYVAKSVQDSAASARAAIDQMVGTFGENTPEPVRKAATTARQNITKSVNKASKISAESKDVGENISAGMNEGIQSRVAALKQSAEKMAEIVILAAKAKLQIKSPSQVFRRIGEFVVEGLRQGLQFTGLESTAGSQLGQFVDAFEKGATDIKDDLMSIGELAFDVASSMQGGFRALAQTLIANASGVAKFGVAALVAVPILDSITNGASEAAIAFESLEARFDFTFGSDGASQLEAMTQSAIALRTDISDARQGYLDFANAVRDTPMENIAEQATTALSQMGRVQQLDPQQLMRARVALTQMASKGGNIQSEELKGQLAEAMPGSMAIFARAQGMSPQELQAQMMQRNVQADTALPAFLSQLEAESSIGVAGAIDTTAASMQNLQNQTLLFQEAVGKPILPLQKMGIDTLAKGIELATNSVGILVQILGTAAIATLGRFTVSLLANVGAATLLKTGMIQLAASSVGFNALVGASTVLRTAISGAGAAISGMKGFLGQSANSMAGFTVGTFALVEGIKLISAAFKDSGGAAREFADSAEESFKRYEEAQKGAFKGGEQSLLETTIFGSILGKNISRFVEQQPQRFLRKIDELDKKSGFDPIGALHQRMTGKELHLGMSYGEKIEQDKNIAMSDSVAISDRVLSRMYSELESGEKISQMRSISEQMRELQTRRALLNPSDVEGRRAIDEEQRKLSNQRVPLERDLRMLTSQTASNIENFKKLRDEAEKTGNTDAYAKATAALEAAQKAQDKFNQSISNSVRSVVQLEAAFNGIQGALRENIQDIDMASAGVRTAIAANENLTIGQREFANLSASQSDLAAKIAANNQSLAEQIALLNDVEQQRVLNQAGFDNNSRPSDVRETAETVTDEATKERLNQAANQMQTIRDLRSESTNLIAQLEDSKQQARQRLIDLGKEIADFNRQMSRGAQDIQYAVEGLQLEAEFARTKTRIEATLGVFKNTFFDDLISGVSELANLLNQLAQIPLQAKQQVQGLVNQQQDNALQAGQLGKQLPGGNTVPFQGIQVTSAVDASGEPGLDYVVANGQRGAQFGALVSGEVIEIQRDDRELGTGGERGYGNTVIVRTVDEATGQITDMLYAHLDDIMVNVGDRLGVGSVIGTQGQTGSTTGPHVSVDFFAEGAYHANPAQLAMRDRIARQLATNPNAFNQQIQQAQSIQPVQSRQELPTSRPGGAMPISTAESYQLAALAIGEAPSRQGRVDVAANVSNRLNAPRAGLAHYGNNLTEVMFARGQYAPFFADDSGNTINPSSVSTEEGVINFLREKGYGADQARQEIRQFLADIQNPQMFADSVRHVGGRTDFKGVTMYGNRVAAEDPLRQHGENYFHINDSQTYEQLGRVAQLAPTAILPEGTGVGASSGMYGNPANAGQIQSGLSTYNNAANSQIAAVGDNAVAQADLVLQQINNALKNYGAGIDLSVREVDTTQIEAERQARRAEFDAVEQTPDVQLQRELFELKARQEDLARDTGLTRVQRSSEGVLKAIEELKRLREQAPEAVRANFDELISKAEDALARSKEAEVQITDAIKDQNAALEKQIQLKQQQFERARERRQFEAREQSNQLRSQVRQEQVSIARSRPYDFLAGRDAAQLELNMGVADAKLAYESSRLNIEEQLRMAGDDETLTAELEKQLELLKQLEAVKLEGLQNQFNLSADAVEQSRLELERRVFDSGIAVQSERSSGMRSLGFDYQADQLDREIGAAQIGADLSAQLAEYDRMQQLLGLSAEKADILRQNAIALSEVKLDNLNNQFGTMGQVIPGLQGAVGGLFSDLIRGTKTAEQSFLDFLGGLADMFAQMAAQMITNQLFGAIMGGVGGMGGANPQAAAAGNFLSGINTPMGGGGMGGGGWVGLVSQFAGAVIGGMADGGTVQPGDFGGLRQRDDAIGRALRQEGGDSVLAALTPGERVLTVEENKRFERLNMIEQIRGFKAGGRIGGAPAPVQPGSMGGGSTVTVDAPITVNTQGGGSEANAAQMERFRAEMQANMEKVAMQTVEKQHKPGGIFDRNKQR